MFEAEIICDSINNGNRVTTFVLQYPRFIHAELLTHRVFSRNAASSRAIPIETVIKNVKENPARFVEWGMNNPGMQSKTLLPVEKHAEAESWWIESSLKAIEQAEKGIALGLHKQIVNRLLEPFTWMRTILTGTDFGNFFMLRVHKDAQPEFQHLAYLMLQQYCASQPKNVADFDWHLPYGDKLPYSMYLNEKLKICTTSIARISYNKTGPSEWTKDISIHDKLAQSGHWSPFDHCCQAIPGMVQNSNFKGWDQYRKSFKNENLTCDYEKLLFDYTASIS